MMASSDEALAKSKNCMSCHATDKKLVGPSYKDVAKKYAGQKDAADKLAAKVIKGGSGVWGPVPMPANAQVNDADAKKRASALGKTMSQTEMLAAKTRLAAWSPEKAPDAANVVAVDNTAWNATAQVGN